MNGSSDRKNAYLESALNFVQNNSRVASFLQNDYYFLVRKILSNLK